MQLLSNYFKNRIFSFIVLMIALPGTHVYAFPTTLTGNGIDWTLSISNLSTDSKSASFKLEADVTNSAFTKEVYLSAFGLKNFGSTATISNLVVDPAGLGVWGWENAGLNAGGCKEKTADDALCVFNESGDVTDAPTSSSDFFFAFDIAVTDILPDWAHLKVHWVDSKGKKVGDLISGDITSSSVTVPEPAVTGLLALGLLSMFVARRKMII